MKKFLSALAIVFVVWFVYNQPAAAADVVHGISDFTVNLFGRTQTFLTQLFS